MSTRKNQLSNIISAIEQANKSNLLDIYVPTQGRYIKFSPLKVSHQKKIIETALESASLSPTYNTLMGSEIINECCQETNVSIYAIDRDPILIGLRALSLGTKTTVQDENGDDIKFNIHDHVNSFSSNKADPEILTVKHITDGQIEIDMCAPSLERDDIVNKQMIPNKKDPKTKDEVKTIIGDAITYEYVKYIQRVTIGDAQIVFDPQRTKGLIQVVESLPMSLSNKIIREINKIKDFERKFTQINDQDRVLTIVTDARFYHSE